MSIKTAISNSRRNGTPMIYVSKRIPHKKKYKYTNNVLLWHLKCIFFKENVTSEDFKFDLIID